MQKRDGRRGSISIVMIVVTVLAMSSVIVASQVANYTEVFGKVFQKDKTKMEAEGIVKMIIRISQLYFQSNYVYTRNDLMAFINPYLSTIVANGYELTYWNLDIDNTSSIETVPSGAFRGMQAESRMVRYWVRLKQTATGIESSIFVEGSIDAITFTQFSAFSFGNFNYWSGVNSLVFDGRIHTNGDFCGGGNPFMRMQYLTSAGSIFHLNSAGNPCGPTFGYTLNIQISNGPPTTFVPLLANNTSGCTNCGGTPGLNWTDYANSRWNGHVQDRSFGVPKLLLPMTSVPTVQNIYRYGDPVGKNAQERFLVDPVLFSDGADVRKIKFAEKADIRIINGVWYVKDIGNPNNWPGIPVWSDHPGHFQTTNEEGIEGISNVGQEDIKNAFIARYGAGSGSVAARWVAGETPKQFSYYEYDTANRRWFDNGEGTVSYGNLFRDVINHWVPGYYPGCTGTPNLLRDYNAATTCAGNTLSRQGRLASATRSGFRFGFWAQDSIPNAESDSKSKILPMNFDLQAFQNAMTCDFDPANPMDLTRSHPGEIGCYFKSWGAVGREFNGIVYITNTWKNQMQGFGTGHAGRQPLMHTTMADAIFSPGTNSDALQPAVVHLAQQTALPFELCSSDLVGPTYNFNSDVFSPFKVTDCTRYDLAAPGGNKLRTRPSDIRIMNGNNISPLLFPRGLSIVSNLNVFLQGDTNTSSDTSTSTAAPWVSMLLGANNILLHSKAWSDDGDRWDVPPSSLASMRIAQTTQYNLAMITGQFPFMLNENWTGKVTRVRSPLLLFYDFAFDNLGPAVSTGSTTFLPGAVDMAYDRHFEFLANQPPGVPFMSFFATHSFLEN